MPQHACIPTEIIQYVDDTLIISEAYPDTLRIIMAVLTRYTKLSSLRLNPNKSTFVPIAISNALTETMRQILLAVPTQLPITYLGLSLMVKKPRKIHSQPMLTTIQNRL